MTEQSEAVKTVVFMTLNLVSVVTIVIINKTIFTTYGFKFGNALMAIHFYATAFCIWVYQKLGGFEKLEQRPSILPKYKDGQLVWAGSLLPISLYQVQSVMFVNWSLMYNSVGLYQILKLANIPVLCVIEYFWKDIMYSGTIRCALFVLIFGIGLTTASDLSFNWIGFTHGMIATLTTAAYQITMKDLQKGMTSVQSCLYVSPVTAAIFTLCVPLTDDWGKLMQYQWTATRATAIFGSGLIAFLINLSVFVIVGRTSPLTYQVVGHVKTTLVLMSGFVFFGEAFEWKNFGGMILAMIGVVWYTYAKLKEGEAEKARKEQQTPVDKEIGIHQKGLNSPAVRPAHG